MPWFKRFIAAALLALTAVAALAWWRNQTSPAAEVSWVNPVPEALRARGVQHVVVASRRLGHEIGVTVYYPKPPRRPTFVVYFFHGRGGDEVRDTAAVLDYLLPAFAELQLPEPVVIFPNAGLTRYREHYAAAFFDEVLPQVEQRFLGRDHGLTRLMLGFSFGAGGAVRFAVQQPQLFLGLLGFGGGMSRDNRAFLAAADASAAELQRRRFTAYLVNGQWDRPNAFAPLVTLWRSRGVMVEAPTLAETRHDWGKYQRDSGPILKEFLHTVLAKQASPEHALGK